MDLWSAANARVFLFIYFYIDQRGETQITAEPLICPDIGAYVCSISLMLESNSLTNEWEIHI